MSTELFDFEYIRLRCRHFHNTMTTTPVSTKPPKEETKKKSDDLSRADFKARVQKYFESVENLNKQRKVEGGFMQPTTVPGLAQHLVWPVDKLVNYPQDGQFADIIEFAMVNLESWLNDAIITKQIDKAVGMMMLKSYFNYTDKDGKKAKDNKSSRSISRVLDEIEQGKTS